jgi:GxxExxY protein
MSIVTTPAVELGRPGDNDAVVCQGCDELLLVLAQRVHTALGNCQSEGTYQRCMAVELRAAGVQVNTETSIPLLYKGQVVGSRRADMVLKLPKQYGGDRAVVEFKAVMSEINGDHMHQLKYYMHTMGINKGYIVNFPHDRHFPDVQELATEASMVGNCPPPKHLSGVKSTAAPKSAPTKTVQIMKLIVV